MKYIRPYKAWFILGPLCMIVEVIGEVLMPMLLAGVINSGNLGTLTVGHPVNNSASANAPAGSSGSAENGAAGANGQAGGEAADAANGENGAGGTENQSGFHPTEICARGRGTDRLGRSHSHHGR